MEFNTECPKCRERATEIAKSCESRFDTLQAKYQKMVMVVAVTSGVVGKEVMNEVYSILSTPGDAVVAPAEKVESPEVISYNYNPSPYQQQDISYLADVPALTPSLGYDPFFNIDIDSNLPNSYDSSIFLPEAGGLLGFTLFS